MLQDHKIRQQYYLLSNQADDYSNIKEKLVSNISEAELVQDVIDYFTIEVPELKYPSKIYAVAIIYAQLLEEYFGVDFHQSLSDPSLFLGNAKEFKTYPESKNVYDRILSSVDRHNLKRELSQVGTSIKAFEQEFWVEYANLADILERINI